MQILYPGSFDPLTFGHLDLVHRASQLCDKVIIAVLENPNKQSTFTINRRIEHIKHATKELKSIEVIAYKGLTVDCARKNNVDLILRGLRAMSDFEYELQISHTNRSLDRSIETIFLATEAHHSFLSSSVVKEVALFGGRVDHMVPEIIAKDLYNIVKNKKSL
ncbi:MULTISPECIES: pantetheine-phosphate adenylyltransferase [unclassified Prochlorococcus]|uniref:pantetheine-phosphate adenylyltransferase n=1 Tax=unclassified Prochlorococcus TaxID=2627481 RepID=UPI000533AEE6|nr:MULTISPECIES: pantetheine-phosphate adenylyltransferase [unclassified Prochlorococcus]KGG15275.1 Phosphopantetheine adenylyltransferase [Prochlorococcus sp. MIT 0602]KGG17552.1 Phosphopantetheine adenylyltransferase [Prochlorococcus sp. MIT 0603]